MAGHSGRLVNLDTLDGQTWQCFWRETARITLQECDVENYQIWLPAVADLDTMAYNESSNYSSAQRRENARIKRQY